MYRLGVRRRGLGFSARSIGDRICWLLPFVVVGSSPLVAEEPSRLVSELPPDTVVCVDIPDIAYLAHKTANTSFGRILTHPHVAPIARGALDSLESKYFVPYRAILGIPRWRLLRSCDGGFRYLITFSDEDGFEQISVFRAQSVEAARSLAARIVSDHRESGGKALSQQFDGVAVTVLERNGYYPERYLVVDKTTVILATSQQRAVQFRGTSATKPTPQRAATASEWKSWLRRTQNALGSHRQAAIVFVHAKQLFQHQPLLRLLASAWLGPEFDGWKFLHGSVEFPARPYSLLVRIKLNRTSEPRAALGPIAWGHGGTSMPDWVPASVSSAIVMRIDPQGTWDRIDRRWATSAAPTASEGNTASPLSQWLRRNGIDFDPETITGRVTVARWFDTAAALNAKSLLLGVELAEPDRIKRTIKEIAARNRGNIRSKRYRSVDYLVFQHPFRIDLDDRLLPKIVKWSSPASPIVRRPSNCFAVIGTDLIYSDNVNALKQAIDAVHSPTNRLNTQLSFKLVHTMLGRSRAGSLVGESYWDPSENWRNLYSLLSKNEMLTAINKYRNPFIEVKKLSGALENRKKIEFHEIAKHIAPSGSVISVMGNDIEWKFMMLERDAEKR